MDGVREQLDKLKAEHRDLDIQIELLANTPEIDQLEIARLKRRKLRLRDEIALCEDRLIPDIIA